MRGEFYTISDLVMMSGLTDRTIRNYIKDGRLCGNKSDGVWLFTEKQVNDFFQSRFVKETIDIKQSAYVDEFLNKDVFSL